MLKLPEVFSKLSQGHKLYFFHELDICIYALGTCVEVINLSNYEVYTIDISGAKNFVSSKKYKKVFFITWQYYENELTLVELSVEEKSYKTVLISTYTEIPPSVAMPLSFSTPELKQAGLLSLKKSLPLFISDDEDYVIIINIISGNLYKINIFDLAIETIVLNPTSSVRVLTGREVCINDAKIRMDFPNVWYSRKHELYENDVYESCGIGDVDELCLANSTKRTYKIGSSICVTLRLILNRSCVDATNMAAQFNWIIEDGSVQPNESITRAETTAIINHMFNHQSVIFDLEEIMPIIHTRQARYRLFNYQHYSRKNDIWIYLLYKKEKDKVRFICEFQRNEEYLFHVELITNNDAYASVKELNDNLILIHLPDALYVCDIDKQVVKELKFLGKKVVNVFIYKEKCYIIPVFSDGVTENMYTVDDFQDADIEWKK